jgi:hypothetical protein
MRGADFSTLHDDALYRNLDRLRKDLERLKARLEKGPWTKPEKLHPAIGRRQAGYPRVARYNRMDYHAAPKTLRGEEEGGKQALAAKWEGGDVRKTDRQERRGEEIGRPDILLRRGEAAFRAMQSRRRERPLFHPLEKRPPTHIFLGVRAYPLRVAREKRFRDRGVHTSWGSRRQQLSTPPGVTVGLPTQDGRVLKIRKATPPEPLHREIYSTLPITAEVRKPIKTGHEPSPW